MLSNVLFQRLRQRDSKSHAECEFTASYLSAMSLCSQAKYDETKDYTSQKAGQAQDYLSQTRDVAADKYNQTKDYTSQKAGQAQVCSQAGFHFIQFTIRLHVCTVLKGWICFAGLPEPDWGRGSRQVQPDQGLHQPEGRPGTGTFFVSDPTHYLWRSTLLSVHSCSNTSFLDNTVQVLLQDYLSQTKDAANEKAGQAQSYTQVSIVSKVGWSCNDTPIRVSGIKVYSYGMILQDTYNQAKETTSDKTSQMQGYAQVCMSSCCPVDSGTFMYLG